MVSCESAHCQNSFLPSPSSSLALFLSHFKMSYDPMFTAIMKAATDPANCKDLKEQQMMEDYYNRLMKAEPKCSPYIYYEDGNSTTSVSSSIPMLSGRCVVCGKSASSRCSACASNGTQWMYFCGKDHQMLVSALRCYLREARRVEADLFALELFRFGLFTNEFVERGQLLGPGLCSRRRK